MIVCSLREYTYVKKTSVLPLATILIIFFSLAGGPVAFPEFGMDLIDPGYDSGMIYIIYLIIIMIITSQKRL